MSLGIGVSDIIFFINQTLILYGQCKGAPAELQAAGTTVDQMRTVLEVLGGAINDRKSFIAKQPAIALMIKHEIKPLKEDLLAVNLVLDHYIDKSKNMGVIGRVRYAVLDRNKLQCIQSNLTKSRTNFGLMLDLINMKANEQHARNDRTGIERLEAILNKQIKEADARKAEARAREKGDAKLEDILQILQQRLPAASKQNDENVSRSQVLGQLEKELQKVGLSKEMAEAARYNAAQALSEAEVSETIRPSPKSIGEPRETNKISGLSPRVELKSRKSSSADRDCHRVPTPTTPTISAALARAAPTATATRSPPDSSPARIVPTATTARNPPYPTLARIAPTATTGSRLPEITKDYRILCVDSTHGIRATLAHTYLEVLRVWTANRTGRWLFRRVHSAGHTVRTDRGTTVDPSTLQGVKELLPQNGYDWAMDYPHETQRIAQRMKFYNRHGFTAHDLTLYDTILCFTHTDASSISKLDTQSEKRAGTAKIIVLPGCRDISSEDCAKDPKKIQELISNIKTAIKGFISRELEDWNDGLVERTQSYRTLQLLLPGLNPRFEEANDFLTDTDKRKEYEIKSGCTIKVTKYKGSTKELLVSIVGPKEHLKEAAALVQSSNIAVS